MNSDIELAFLAARNRRSASSTFPTEATVADDPANGSKTSNA